MTISKVAKVFVPLKAVIVSIVRVGGVVPAVLQLQPKPGQEPGSECRVVGPAREVQVVLSVGLQGGVASVVEHDVSW